jgi:hypothetical protein
MSEVLIEVLEEAILDSVKLLPFLLGVYVAVAVLEYRYGDAISRHILKAGKAGPLLGALFGGIPQCGFSVMGSALYSRRLITTGTLLAVFISTSDEAIPVLLSQPDSLGWLLPIMGTKIVLAIAAGYGIDLVLRAVRSRRAGQAAAGETQHAGDVRDEEPLHHGTGETALRAEYAGVPHHHEATVTAETPAETHAHPEIDEVLREHGCCDHHIAGDCPRQPSRWSTLLWHPLKHTAKVFAFIFLVTLALGYLSHRYEDTVTGLLLPRHLLLQPVLTALVGLIPNCAASVAITQLLIAGKITFGAAIAGLSTSAGVGLLVLLKENRNRRNTLFVLGLLLAISIAVGMLLQVLLPASWAPV